MPEITELLLRWGHGDQRALDQLVPLIHHELHQIAQRHMAHERADHSLQATALVNETYLRLVDTKHVSWHDRAHFLAVCAQVMRRIGHPRTGFLVAGLRDDDHAAAHKSR